MRSRRNPPRHRRSLSGMALVSASLLLIVTAGCQAPRKPALERELVQCRETLAQQRDQLAAQQTQIQTLTTQLDAVRGIDADDLKRIFHPEKIVIGDLSGGYDRDEQPGDDGVVVYVKPVDQTGDVIKAAGDIRIQLYDLAEAPARSLVGEYDIPIEESRKLWYGKLWTSHYTIYCPWTGATPAHSEITVRVTFIDYLTKRVMTAQKPVAIELPPR